VAQTQPDIDLLPWVEKELCRLALRHYEEDTAKAAKFLGIPAAEVEAKADHHAPAPSAATKKPAGKKPASV
jgi:DNA-binding NtrC family response regulator